MTDPHVMELFLEAGELSHALDDERRAWENQPPPEHFRNVAYTDADRDLLLDREEEKDWERSEGDYHRFMGWE